LNPEVRKLSSRYKFIVLGSALLLMLLLVLLGLNRYRLERRAFLNESRTRVMEKKDGLERELERASDHLRLMKFWMEHFTSAPEFRPLAPRVELLTDNGEYFSLDEFLPPFDADNTGGLVGLGSLDGRPGPYYRELRATLGMLDLQWMIHRINPHYAWSYYHSRNDLTGYYPWILPSKMFELGFDDMTSVFEHKYSTRRWRSALPANNPQRRMQWTEAYMDYAGKGLMVTLTLPVYDGDEFLGMVGADLTLDFLTYFINEGSLPAGGLVLFNARDQVLATSDTKALKEGEIPVLSQVAPEGLLPQLDRSGSREIVNIDGLNVFLTELRNAPWLLAYTITEKELFWQVLPNLSVYILLLLGLLVFLRITHHVVTVHFVRPAIALVEYVVREAQHGEVEAPDVPFQWRPWFRKIHETFQLKTVAGNLPGAVFRMVRQRDGTVVLRFASDGVEKLLGLRPDELVGRDLESTLFLRGVEDWKKMLEALEKSASILSPLQYECRLGSKEGESSWVRFLARPRVEGEETWWEGLMLDISEQREAERALVQSEARLRLIMEHMPILLWARDARGRAVFWNKECERTTGYEAEEVLGASDIEVNLYPREEYRKGMLEILELSRGDYMNLELQLTTKDGEQRIVSWSDISGAYPVPGWDSWQIGVDITKRKLAEEERIKLEKQFLEVQKNESLRIMAGGTAHHFNNLLTAVIGYIQMAAWSLDPESTAARHLDNAGVSAQKAARLSKLMLTYVGQGKMHPRELFMEEMLEEIREAVESSCGKSTVEVACSGNRFPFRADPDHVRRIVTNLAANACEAMEDNPGKVLLSSGAKEIARDSGGPSRPETDLAPGRYVYFQVSDTGSGMDPPTISKMFDPFFTTKETGRGLGMAEVLGLVRLNEGGIRIESEPGRGTAITILFPALEPRED